MPQVSTGSEDPRPATKFQLEYIATLGGVVDPRVPISMTGAYNLIHVLKQNQAVPSPLSDLEIVLSQARANKKDQEEIKSHIEVLQSRLYNLEQEFAEFREKRDAFFDEASRIIGTIAKS